MLRDHGPQERIFNEIQTAQENEFNFFNEEDAQDTAERLCLAMQFFPPVDYLTGNDIMYEYDPEVISSVQDQLVPDRCNIMILSREYSKECKLKEKWFGTRYSSEAIGQEWEDAWKDLKDNPELHLPPPNPFIATDLTIKDLDSSHPHTKYPVVIDESDKYRLWYRQDTLHKMPIASARFLLKSRLHIKSVRNVVLMELFMRLYRLVVIETVYDAEAAHLMSGLSIYYGGIALIVNGLNDNLSILFKLLVKKLIDFDVSELLFQTEKEEANREYLNSPLSIKGYSSMLRMKLLLPIKWTSQEKLAALKELTREDLMSFFAEFKKHLFAEALVQGNILAQEAKSLMEYFVREWEYTPVTFDHASKVLQIPSNTEVVLQADNMDPNSPSNAVTNLYQLSRNTSTFIRSLYQRVYDFE